MSNFVQANQGSGGYPGVIPYGSPVTKGDLLVVIANNLSAVGIFSISDNQGHSWTSIPYSSGSSNSVFSYTIAKANYASSVLVVSVDYTDHNAGIQCFGLEYANVSIFDQSAGGPGTNSIGTTKAPGTLIAATSGIAGGTISAGAGYTLRGSIQSGFAMGVEDQDYSSNNTFSASFTNPAASTFIANFSSPPPTDKIHNVDAVIKVDVSRQHSVDCFVDDSHNLTHSVDCIVFFIEESAFQPNAFQENAFQILGSNPPTEVYVVEAPVVFNPVINGKLYFGV